MLLQYNAGMFNNVVQTLQNLGFWDVILPFLLIFAIIYSILKKSGVFSEDKISSIVAASIALFAVVPHVMGVYPVGFDIVEILKAFFPQVALLLVVIVVVLILTGALTGAKGEFPESWKKNMAIVALILVGSLLLFSMYPQTFAWGWLDSSLVTAVVTLLSMGLIIYWLMS